MNVKSKRVFVFMLLLMIGVGTVPVTYHPNINTRPNTQNVVRRPQPNKAYVRPQTVIPQHHYYKPIRKLQTDEDTEIYDDPTEIEIEHEEQPTEQTNDGEEHHYDEEGEEHHYDEADEEHHYDESGEEHHYEETGEELHEEEPSEASLAAEDAQIEHEEVKAAVAMIEFKLTEVNELIKECIEEEFATKLFADKDVILTECSGLGYQILIQNYKEGMRRVKQIFLEILKKKTKSLDSEYDDEVMFFLDTLEDFVDKDFKIKESLEISKEAAKYYVSPHFYDDLIRVADPELVAFNAIHHRLHENKKAVQDLINNKIAERNAYINSNESEIEEMEEPAGPESSTEQKEYEDEHEPEKYEGDEEDEEEPEEDEHEEEEEEEPEEDEHDEDEEHGEEEPQEEDNEDGNNAGEKPDEGDQESEGGENNKEDEGGAKEGSDGEASDKGGKEEEGE